MYGLAMLLWKGQGVPRNTTMALALITVAEERGSKAAIFNREKYAAALTGEQKDKAARLAADWRKRIADDR